MSNSSQGLDVNRMALDGLSQVMDSMDRVKRAWSGFNLATPFTPTLDVTELDKRIGDLRAVEQWLSLNQNMLRSTIQGLEIQRGTLSAFNSVTETFGQAAARPADGPLAQTFARFAAAAAQRSVASAGPAEAAARDERDTRPAAGFDWSPLAMPSAAAFSSAAAKAPAAATPATDAAPATEEPVGGDPTPAAGVDPLGWWQMLQENFRQIAQAATAQVSNAADSVSAAGDRTADGAASDGQAGRGDDAKAGVRRKARPPQPGAGTAKAPAGARKAAKAKAPGKGPGSRRGKAGTAGGKE